MIANAFRTYDPSGTVELEDREKLVLMRNYIRDYHAKMQTTIALWQSENAERMAGDMIAGDMVRIAKPTAPRLDKLGRACSVSDRLSSLLLRKS